MKSRVGILELELEKNRIPLTWAQCQVSSTRIYTRLRLHLLDWSQRAKRLGCWGGGQL